MLPHMRLHPGGGDLHHIDLGTDIGQHAFHLRQSPGQHRQAMGHRDLVDLHNLHQLLHKDGHINLSHLQTAVFVDQLADIPVQLGCIRLPTKLAQHQHGILDHADIIHGDTLDRLAQLQTVPFGEPPHHAHIDPDDLTAAYTHIARMGIGMEKAILHDLPDIIVHQLAADLLQIVTVIGQGCFVIYGKTIDILHHQHMLCRILPVQLRRYHKGHVFIVAGKFLHIGSLGEEIHLLLCHRPHLIKHHVKIYQFFDAHRWKQLDCLVHHGDISRHQFIDARTLYLDNYGFSCLQNGMMYLRNRSRPQWFFVQFFKNLLPRTAKGLQQYLFHLGKRHRCHIGTQPHQLIAVLLWQNVRMQGHDLSELDIGRSQLLEDQPELFRSQSLHDLMFFQHRRHFLQAGTVAFFCRFFTVHPVWLPFTFCCHA